MAGKKYVMTSARKAALRKAQEKAWGMRRRAKRARKLRPSAKTSQMAKDQTKIEALNEEVARIKLSIQLDENRIKRISPHRDPQAMLRGSIAQEIKPKKALLSVKLRELRKLKAKRGPAFN
jgi:hypothetical protein